MMKKNLILNVWLCVALMLCCVMPVAHAVAADDASGFVLVSEAVPDAILEIRYYSTYNFVGDRIDGYNEPVALLTREAAAALREVSDEVMQQGYRLKIYDAYRPQPAVQHFIRWVQDRADTRMKPYFYPELDKSALFQQGYIGSRSGHSRGSTVDLTLFDMSTGKEVDMGGTYDYFGTLSHPDFRGITEEQRANRMLLRNAMKAHGFKPISTEWWHFTLSNEPYPSTYFTFPVEAASIPQEGRMIRLKRGMKGSEVRYYQELLIEMGFLEGKADGDYGPATESAVIRLQQSHGLEPTGEITDVEAGILQGQDQKNTE